MTFLRLTFTVALHFAVLFFAVHGARAQSQNGEIRGFRYQACEAAKCLVVEAPRAWLSAANGAFVAEESGHEGVTFRLLNNRKVVREVKAHEIVLRPEIEMMTVESADEVLLVDLHTYELEAVRK